MSTYMVQELSLLMSNLLEHGHDELKFIFRDRNTLRLFSLARGTFTRAFAAIFIILVQPFFVALVHIVYEAIGKRKLGGFLH